MSASNGGRREPASAPNGARPGGIAGPTRADLVSSLPLGDLATVDEELFSVFELEERATTNTERTWQDEYAGERSR